MHTMVWPPLWHKLPADYNEQLRNLKSFYRKHPTMPGHTTTWGMRLPKFQEGRRMQFCSGSLRYNSIQRQAGLTTISDWFWRRCQVAKRKPFASWRQRFNGIQIRACNKSLIG